MGQDSLDRIKDKLIHHEAAIDSDALWTGIQQKRIAASAIAKGKFLAIGILLLTLLGTLAYGYFAPDEQTKSNMPNYPQEALNNATDYATNNEKESYTETSTTEPESAATLLRDNNRQYDQSAILAKAKSNSEHSNSYYTGSSNKSNGTKSTDRHTPINNTLVNRNSTVDNTGQAETKDQFAANLSSSLSNNTGQDIAVRKGSDLLTAARWRSPGIGMTDLKSIEYNSGIPPLPASMARQIECYDYSGKKGSFSLYALSGLDYNIRSLTSAAENSTYLDERKSTESLLIGWHSGLGLKYTFDNGLYIKGGLEYGQIRERFNYRRVTETTEILPGQIIQIDIQPNGDTTFVYGNAPVTTIEMKNWRVGNTYKVLDITSLIGYEMERGSLVYSAELGAAYNMHFGFNGLILDPADEPFTADGFFKDKINWSVLAALNVGYRMNSRATIFGGLNYRGILDNINTNSNPIDQKYNRIGLHAGIEFKLN